MGRRIDAYPIASSFAGDDYVLIDGRVNGTRAILASDLQGGGGGQITGITIDVIGDPYDPNNIYDVGDSATYNNKFWTPKRTTSVGTFNPSDWNQVDVVAYMLSKDNAILVTVGQIHDDLTLVSGTVSNLSGRMTTVETKVASILSDICDTFSSTETYNDGDMVIHDNVLYVCTSLVPVSGSWASISSSFSTITIVDAIHNVELNVESIASTVGELNTAKSIYCSDYDSTHTYNTGDYVTHNNQMYRCNSDYVSGTWDDLDWTRTDILTELMVIKANAGGAHTYQGTTEPTVSLGNDGDIYLQYGSNGISVVYGKILGQWMEFPSGSGGTIVQALEHIANTQLSTTPSPLSFTGHVKVTLTDDATQQETVIESDNMQTNGLAEFFTNCGFMNSDNTDRNNLVKQLLGGMLAFDSTVTPSASTVLPPSSASMVANAAYDISNGSTTGDPSEMGNWVAEGTDGSGWKDDGSYHFVWEWGLSQGNGTIAAISLTSRNWGWVGLGNAISNVRKPSSAELTNTYGSSTTYTITGVPCRLSISDSSVYGVVFDTTNDKIIIHKYRLPLTSLNLKGTTSICQEMQEPVELTMPADLKTNLTYSGYTQGITVNNRLIQDNGTTLICLSANQGSTEWGNGYDQKMWEIDPVAGTCTESTIPNLYSGTRTMYTMREAIWIDKDTVAWINGYYGYAYSQLRETDIIYSMKRTNGTWGNFQECANTFGWELSSRSLGSGRMLLCNGYGTNASVFNFGSNTIEPVNMTYGPATNSTVCKSNDKPMISYIVTSDSTTVDCTITVMRMQNYLATVWTPSQPFTKTSGQFMRIDYGVFFNEYEPDSDSDSDTE